MILDLSKQSIEVTSHLTTKQLSSKDKKQKLVKDTSEEDEDLSGVDSLDDTLDIESNDAGITAALEDRATP